MVNQRGSDRVITGVNILLLAVVAGLLNIPTTWLSQHNNSCEDGASFVTGNASGEPVRGFPGSAFLGKVAAASESLHERYVAFYKDTIYDLADDRLAEAHLAVLSFAVSAFFFSGLHILGLPKMNENKKKSHPLRDRVISSPLGPFVFWTFMNVFVYLGVIDVSQRLAHSQLSDMNVISRPPQEPPSFIRLAVEVAFSVFAYDFIFYWAHRSFHQAGAVCAASSANAHPWLKWWHGLHLAHHDHYKEASKPLHVLVTFHHHIVDASMQVGVNIIVQQIPLLFLWSGPRHTLSKLLHNVVVTYLLVEAHSGYDLPFMSHRLFPAIFGGSVRHQEHHRVGRRYFHQFFRYLDDYLGPIAGSEAGTSHLD